MKVGEGAMTPGISREHDTSRQRPEARARAHCPKNSDR